MFSNFFQITFQVFSPRNVLLHIFYHQNIIYITKTTWDLISKRLRLLKNLLKTSFFFYSEKKKRKGRKGIWWLVAVFVIWNRWNCCKLVGFLADGKFIESTEAAAAQSKSCCWIEMFYTVLLEVCADWFESRPLPSQPRSANIVVLLGCVEDRRCGGNGISPYILGAGTDTPSLSCLSLSSELFLDS